MFKYKNVGERVTPSVIDRDIHHARSVFLDTIITVTIGRLRAITVAEVKRRHCSENQAVLVDDVNVFNIVPVDYWF